MLYSEPDLKVLRKVLALAAEPAYPAATNDFQFRRFFFRLHFL
jgi:hypothetical protein